MPLICATYPAYIVRFLRPGVQETRVKRAKSVLIAYLEVVSKLEMEAVHGGNPRKQSVPRLRRGRGVHHPPPRHAMAGRQGREVEGQRLRSGHPVPRQGP